MGIASFLGRTGRAFGNLFDDDESTTFLGAFRSSPLAGTTAFKPSGTPGADVAPKYDRPSAWEYLRYGPKGVEDKRKREADAAQRAEIKALADQLQVSPRERLIMLANPEKWAEQNAERYGVTNVAAGSTANYGDPFDGGGSYTAPQYGFSEGRGYVQGPDGLREQGRLEPSYAESTDRFEAQTGRMTAEHDAQFDRDRLELDRAVRMGQLSVSQANVELSRRREARAVAGRAPSGSPGTPAATVSGGPSRADVIAELRRRGY